MKIYYNTNGKILDVWCAWLRGGEPEIPTPHSVIELDEEYNRSLAGLLLGNDSRAALGLPDLFFVNEMGQLVDNDTDEVVTINLNPQKEAYKLSQLYGLTHAELDIYIDNNVTDLASAREFVRKMAHVILWLVKQTKLEE